MGYDLNWADGPDDEAANFRANVWRWRALCDEMERQGMLKYCEPTGDLDEDTGAGGIPIYKLCSNDGWLVTPAEIEWALTYGGQDEPLALVDDGERTARLVSPDEAADLAREGYEVHERGDGLRLAVGRFPVDQAGWLLSWYDWLLFLRGAIDHGGIRVW